MTFQHRPLRGLLMEAVRYGSDPVVDNTINRDELQKLIASSETLYQK